MVSTAPSPVQGATLTAIWASSPSSIWVAVSGSPGQATPFIYYNGSTWTAVSGGANYAAVGLWGSGPGDVWAVGSTGQLAHFDGGTWGALPAPTTGFSGVFGADATDVWAVGPAGAILRYRP
jgi:hypothetical protein